MIIEDQTKRNEYDVFKDRSDAGNQLITYLESMPIDLLLAIPNGGVPVLQPLIEHFNVKFNLLLIRKIQLPWNPEAGFGAVTPDGQVFYNENLLHRLELGEKQAKRQVEAAKQKIDQRREQYNLQSYEVQGKSVVLVDDGIASGFSMIAGVNWLKKQGARTVIIAVPTAPQGSLDKLKDLADTIICLNVRSRYPFAVADAYQDWYDVPTSEVKDILANIR